VSLRRLFGEGKFAVIASRRLNDEPLTRAEADRLAKSSPAKAPRAGVEVSPPPPKRKAAAASAPRPAPAVDLPPFVHLVARDRHHPHPRMVKPAEPPALSQGSARKSTAGAGWGALCTAGAGFRCGFGGVDVGGAVDALARRSASALVNGVSLSLWPAMTANLSFPIEMMKCSSLIRADIHPSFDPKRPSFAILQADVQVESFAQRGGFRGGGFEKAIPFGPATYSLWTPRAIPLSSIPTR
jgi:hypothetical protein